MKFRTITAVTALMISAPLLAHEEPAAEPEEVSPWAGVASLGYLATSGNTENSSLNSAFAISYQAEKWLHEAGLAAIYSEENDATTSEAYDAGWKSSRSLTDKDYLFGKLDWRKDRFSSYESQFSQAVGYGRRLIESGAHSLDGELGVGARQSELIDGTKEDETIGTGALRYRWGISDTSEFRQDLLVEAGGENVFTESVTAISARLVGALALTASYTIRNNSEVLPGTEKTDTFTALSLEYTF